MLLSTRGKDLFDMLLTKLNGELCKIFSPTFVEYVTTAIRYLSPFRVAMSHIGKFDKYQDGNS